jgi:UDP-3-O-[3-hydroxymyristoyl] glucosamine N-acyltransferase
MSEVSYKPVLVEPQALADLFLMAQANVRCAATLDTQDVRVTHIAPLDLAGADAFAFLSNPKFREQLLHCRASVIALSAADFEWLQSQNTDTSQSTFVICAQPYALFAMVAQRLYMPAAPEQTSIHNSAVIAPNAQIGKNVCIGAHVTVDEYAQIGDNAVLEAGVVIGRYARIGASSHIYPNVTVYHGCEIGARCIIHAGAVIGSDGFGFAPTPTGWYKIPQVGRVLVGDDVEIGANTAIDRGALTDTVVHNGVKIDNLVHIAHNCVIGQNTAIAACVGMAGSTEIGASCMIGGGAMLGGHLSIVDNTIVSGGTAIISDIKTAGQYSGIYPASTHREWERNAPLIRHLADLRKRIRSVQKNAESNQPSND